jgi:hypothetical protein
VAISGPRHRFAAHGERQKRGEGTDSAIEERDLDRLPEAARAAHPLRSEHRCRRVEPGGHLAERETDEGRGTLGVAGRVGHARDGLHERIRVGRARERAARAESRDVARDLVRRPLLGGIAGYVARREHYVCGGEKPAQQPLIRFVIRRQRDAAFTEHAARVAPGL